MGITELEERGRMSYEEDHHLGHGDIEEELQDLGWYHDGLTRHAAEALLLSNGSDGSYLLRKSNGKTDLFSLSVRAKDSVKHFHVEYTGYSFKFGFNEFPSLKELIKHFANQPLIGSETEKKPFLMIKSPLPEPLIPGPQVYPWYKRILVRHPRKGSLLKDHIPSPQTGALQPRDSHSPQQQKNCQYRSGTPEGLFPKPLSLFQLLQVSNPSLKGKNLLPEIHELHAESTHPSP